MSGSRVTSNAIWNIAPFALGFLVNLVVVHFVVRWIGIDEYGLYGLLAVVVAPLTLANLGFGEATVKYVAEAAHAGDLERAGRYLRTTLAMNLVVGVVGAVLLAFAIPPVVQRIFDLPLDAAPRVRAVLRAVACAWLANQASGVFLAIPPAFQRFRLVAAGHVASQILLAAASTAGAYLGGLVGFAFGNALGALLSAIVWRSLARALLPGISLMPSVDADAWRDSLRFGGWQVAAQLGTMVANQAERFLLGVFLAPAAVGFYNIAQGLEQRVYSAVYKMSEVLFPHFSTLGRADRTVQTGLLLRASWILTALAVCALGPLIPLASPLLATWISPEAAVAATPTMQALALAGILGCATNASFFFLLGMADTKGLALLSGVTGLTTLIGAIVVLPRWGLPAAGVAAALGMIAQQLCLALVLLPRRLRGALRQVDLIPALYAPVIAGLLVAGGALVLGTGVLRGWMWLLAAYAAIAALTGFAILVTSEILPGRMQRRRDLATILSTLARPFGVAG